VAAIHLWAGGGFPGAKPLRVFCGDRAVGRRRRGRQRAGAGDPAAGRRRRPGCGPAAAQTGSGYPAAGWWQRSICGPVAAFQGRTPCGPSAATAVDCAAGSGPALATRLRAGGGELSAGRQQRSLCWPASGDPAAGRRLRSFNCAPAAATRLRVGRRRRRLADETRLLVGSSDAKLICPAKATAAAGVRISRSGLTTTR
jgi:hypothetical protein